MDCDDISRRSLDQRNARFQKWLEIQAALGSLAGGRFPVTLPVMHGPLDILSAARGPERLCLDLQDRPHEVERALSALTDLWIDSARALLPATPLPAPHASKRHDMRGAIIRLNIYCSKYSLIDVHK